jgi:hypothetical protein
MGAREFVRWRVFFEEEWNTTEKVTDYLAQIACEVRRGYVRDPGRVKLDDFIIKYTPANKKPQMTKEEYLQNSKNYWTGILGFFGVKPKVTPPPGT